MSEDRATFFKAFSEWLRTLGQDAEGMAALIGLQSLDGAAREQITGGLQYLFKTLDLIPDGIDDIGYLDDAFVLRVSAELAVMSAGMGGDGADETVALQKLSEDCEVIRLFMQDDYPRLRNYVKGLRQANARGRSVADVVTDADARAAMLADVQSFSAGFTAPTFRHDERNLIKMRAFLDAKLPR